MLESRGLAEFTQTLDHHGPIASTAKPALFGAKWWTCCWAAAGGVCPSALARRADCAAAQTEEQAMFSLLSPDTGSLAERDALGHAGTRAAWAPPLKRLVY